MSGRVDVLSQLSAAELTVAQDKLDRFMKLIDKWNRSIKLVSYDHPGELRERHLVDCFSVVGELTSGWRVVDVGSGGGFPSVVIAILRPAVDVAALEPIHKKHAFLSTVKRELELPNLEPFAERDRDHLARPGFAPYDAAVSRATFAVPEWLDRGLALVRPGGIVIAMEAREQHALPAGTTRIPYPLGDRQRALLVRTRG